MTQSPLFKRIYIIPGVACNFKCRYCSSSYATAHLKKSISDDTIRFLHELAGHPEYRSRHGRERLNVIFLGGEPLLYFDVLKELYERVAEPDVFQWKVVTNGSLLDATKVDWFNRNSFRVLISHDGPNTEKTRGRDIFKDRHYVDLYKALDNPAIETVLTAYNQDIHGYMDAMRHLLGDTFKARLMFLMTSPSTPLDLVDYDLDAWANTSEKMVVRYKNNEKGCDVTLVEKHLRLFRMNFHRVHKEWGCNIRAGNIRLSLDGQFLNCLSAPCGNLKSGLAKHFTQMESTVSFSFKNNRRACFSCPYYSFCNGHCPMIVPNPAQEKQCLFMKTFFESLFQLVR